MAEELGEKDIELAEKVGKIQSEVHTLSTNNTTLFSKLDKMSDKFDEFITATRPKPATPLMILGGALTTLTILALLFGSMIYITSSTTAPITMQMNQLVSSIATVNNSVMQVSSQIQLTNKELSSIKREAQGNAQTLEWLLFQENVPKQITRLQEKVIVLEKDSERYRGILFKGVPK